MFPGEAVRYRDQSRTGLCANLVNALSISGLEPYPRQEESLRERAAPGLLPALSWRGPGRQTLSESLKTCDPGPSPGLQAHCLFRSKIRERIRAHSRRLRFDLPAIQH